MLIIHCNAFGCDWQFSGQLTTEEVLDYSVVNSTSFMVKWLLLQFPFCVSNCNSTMTQYKVRYGLVASNKVYNVYTTEREFNATGLLPLSNYSFEVTAIDSDNHTGRFTDPVYFFTPAECKNNLIHTLQMHSSNLSF